MVGRCLTRSFLFTPARFINFEFHLFLISLTLPAQTADQKIITGTIRFSTSGGDELLHARMALYIRDHHAKYAIDLGQYKVDITTSERGDLLGGLEPSMFESDTLAITPDQEQAIKAEYLNQDNQIVNRKREIEAAVTQNGKHCVIQFQCSQCARLGS